MTNKQKVFKAIELMTKAKALLDTIQENGVALNKGLEQTRMSLYEAMLFSKAVISSIPMNSDDRLNDICKRRTGFNTFEELLDAKGNYRPSILVRDIELLSLADAYDGAQYARGDERRAYRVS